MTSRCGRTKCSESNLTVQLVKLEKQGWEVKGVLYSCANVKDMMTFHSSLLLSSSVWKSSKMVTPLLCLQLATDFFLRFGDVLKLGKVQSSLRAVFFLLANFHKNSTWKMWLLLIQRIFHGKKWTKSSKFGKEKNSIHQISTISSSR